MDGVEDAEDTSHSGKMMVLMAILDAAAKAKEKLLLFSQVHLAYYSQPCGLGSNQKWI